MVTAEKTITAALGASNKSDRANQLHPWHVVAAEGRRPAKVSKAWGATLKISQEATGPPGCFVPIEMGKENLQRHGVASLPVPGHF